MSGVKVMSPAGDDVSEHLRLVCLGRRLTVRLFPGFQVFSFNFKGQFGDFLVWQLNKANYILTFCSYFFY